MGPDARAARTALSSACARVLAGVVVTPRASSLQHACLQRAVLHATGIPARFGRCPPHVILSQGGAPHTNPESRPPPSQGRSAPHRVAPRSSRRILAGPARGKTAPCPTSAPPGHCRGTAPRHRRPRWWSWATPCPLAGPLCSMACWPTEAERTSHTRRPAETAVHAARQAPCSAWTTCCTRLRWGRCL